MPCLLLTALLAVATAPLQTQPSTQTAPPATTAKASSVPSAKKTQAPAAATTTTNNATLAPTTPVITLHGLCASESGKNKPDAACSTVVTRQQFDAVVNALNAIGPSLLPVQRRGVAEGYAATLLTYEAARKAGVERDPRFTEVMRLARMRAMGDMYNALLQEKAKKVSPQAVQAYYANNIDKFEELTMRRVTLPRYNSANLKDEEFAARASKVANDIHDRMAKGEDVDSLQKEAFAALGVKDPPPTRMAVVRRGIYSADQEKQLFALKPGEVTAIIEQASALIIFKMEGRETPSLEKSKDEIVRILIKQNVEKQEQARSSSVQIDYNEQYLGAAPTSAWIPASQLNASPKDHQAGGDSKTAPSKSEQPK
jgi:hypothetical protein